MSTVPPATDVNSRPRRSASGMNGCTVALASLAARFTANGTNSPRSASTTCSAIVWPALSCASAVDAPRWGVTTTLSSSNSGDSVVGSCTNTSSAAPAMRPSRTASASAASSTIPPRAVLTMRRLGLAWVSSSAEIRPDGVGRLGQVDGEEVGAGDELLDRRDEVDADLAGTVGAHVRVVGHELHAERVGALRDEHADATEADDAERLVVELDALPPRAVPLVVLEVAVGLGDVPCLGEQQGDRVLGRRQHVGLRRVDDHHAASRGGFDVDVVETDAGPPDDDHLVGRFEHLGRDLRRAADHERGRAAHRFEQLGRPTGRDGRRPRARRRASPRARCRRAAR